MKTDLSTTGQPDAFESWWQMSCEAFKSSFKEDLAAAWQASREALVNEPRVTDEELCEIGDAAYNSCPGTMHESNMAMVLAIRNAVMRECAKFEVNQNLALKRELKEADLKIIEMEGQLDQLRLRGRELEIELDQKTRQAARLEGKLRHAELSRQAEFEQNQELCKAMAAMRAGESPPPANGAE